MAGSARAGDGIGGEEGEEDEDDLVENEVRAEEYFFEGFPAPLDIHPDELLLHTAQIIVVPRKSGYSAFRRFLVEGNPTALDVVEHVFWYLHCKFFHHDITGPQQAALLVRSLFMYEAPQRLPGLATTRNLATPGDAASESDD